MTGTETVAKAVSPHNWVSDPLNNAYDWARNGVDYAYHGVGDSLNNGVHYAGLETVGYHLPETAAVVALAVIGYAAYKGWFDKVVEGYKSRTSAKK
jgi:hypothetical protein